MWKKMIQLGVKNLVRYQRRTMITATVIAYGVIIYVFTSSILAGLDQESKRTYLWYETSAAKIFSEEYFEERNVYPLDYTFNPTEVGEKLESGGLTWTPRTVFQADIIMNGRDFKTDGSIARVINAVDVERDAKVFKLRGDLEGEESEGRWLNSGKPEVVIGSWLAQDLGGDLGDFFTVSTKTKEGVAQVFDLEIVGIVVSTDMAINTAGIFIPLDFADEFLELGGTVSEINVETPSVKAAASIHKKAQSLLEGSELRAYSWKEIATSYTEIANSKKGSTTSILMVIAIIAALGIINTLLMAIFERVREIGMMMALGMTKKEMRRLFLVEATLIGVVGAFMGVLLSLALNWFFVKFGLDMSSLYSDSFQSIDMGYRSTWKMYGVWEWRIFLTPFAFAIFISWVIGLFATKRIERMEIVDCLRHE